MKINYLTEVYHHEFLNQMRSSQALSIAKNKGLKLKAILKLKKRNLRSKLEIYLQRSKTFKLLSMMTMKITSYISEEELKNNKMMKKKMKPQLLL